MIKHCSISSPDMGVLNDALDALNADELRALVCDILPWLDEKTRAKAMSVLIDHAARGEAGWIPSGPGAELVAEVLDFVDAARREGCAEPSDVDEYLRQGMNAFFTRDYRTTLQIFRVLVVPISDCEIDLGQHELVDEVLGVDIADCAAQYVVAIYMMSAPTKRARAVKAAIDEMSAVGHFWQPIENIEQMAIEPLPGFDDFLSDWHYLLCDLTGEERNNEWDTEIDRWRREVALRLEGTDGLATIAKSSRRSSDLRAWCQALVEARDWEGALAACDEAAEIVANKQNSTGDFRDGSALAAQELGRKDLPIRLERAWRVEPSFLRLRRWLGTSTTKVMLRNCTATAIEDCPQLAHRQRAFLHVLLGDFTVSAKLLAAAPGLGWSREEHPGHLLFPIFLRVLAVDSRSYDLNPGRSRASGIDCNEYEACSLLSDEPKLNQPLIEELLALADIMGMENDCQRPAMLKAMRKAAEKRIEVVTKNKHRRCYAHAASLAAACAVADDSSGAANWFDSIRDDYRRFPALQREFDRYAGDR